MASSDLQDAVELQLSEVELLQSMFPADGEFCLDDPSVVWDLRSFVDDTAGGSGPAKCEFPDELAIDPRGRGDGEGADAPAERNCLRQISFVIKVNVTLEGQEMSNITLELQCNLPLDYPKSLPELNVQSNALSRRHYKALNDALKEHLQTLERGELCMMETVQWLQENASNYLSAITPSEEDIEKGTELNRSVSFTRLWIHSHHIYSRSKRGDICEWARERELTGFSLPGKPGIICVEGPREDVDEFWHKLRRLNWKKLTSKHREDFDLDSGGGKDLDKNFQSWRHFMDFLEINFDVRGSRDYHMDLGQFFQYLEKHGCADVFKILLGVDGRVSQKDTA